MATLFLHALVLAFVRSQLVTFPPHLVGTAPAVEALLERVLPGSASHFAFTISRNATHATNRNSFELSDTADGKTAIRGTTASELTAGLGFYLRELCNITVGWTRGGGSRVVKPAVWPTIGPTPIVRSRSVPYSHVTQVCTHSYTLAWHDWSEWEKFIDWMALAGHNSIVAPTGQEEVGVDLTQSVSQSVSHSLNQSLTHLLTHSLTHSSPHTYTHSRAAVRYIIDWIKGAKAVYNLTLTLTLTLTLNPKH